MSAFERWHRCAIDCCVCRRNVRSSRPPGNPKRNGPGGIFAAAAAVDRRLSTRYGLSDFRKAVVRKLGTPHRATQTNVAKAAKPAQKSTTANVNFASLVDAPGITTLRLGKLVW